MEGDLVWLEGPALHVHVYTFHPGTITIYNTVQTSLPEISVFFFFLQYSHLLAAYPPVSC